MSQKRTMRDLDDEEPPPSKSLKIEEEAGDELDKERKTPDRKRAQLSRRVYRSLLHSIQNQMEFYFSNANLSKSSYMKNVINSNEERYVYLWVFSRFNKLQSLMDGGVSMSTLQRAIAQSDILELSPNKLMVRRKTPFQEMSEEIVNSRTVYVEHLPKNVTQEWIKDIFSKCGNIAYICLPKYKYTKILKGFAFVEFTTAEEASIACRLLNNPPPSKVEEKPGKFPKRNKTLDRLHRKITEKTATLESDDSNDENKMEIKKKKKKKKKQNQSSGEPETTKSADDSQSEKSNTEDEKIETKKKKKKKKKKIKCEKRKQKSTPKLASEACNPEDETAAVGNESEPTSNTGLTTDSHITSIEEKASHSKITSNLAEDSEKVEDIKKSKKEIDNKSSEDDNKKRKTEQNNIEKTDKDKENSKIEIKENIQRLPSSIDSRNTNHKSIYSIKELEMINSIRNFLKLDKNTKIEDVDKNDSRLNRKMRKFLRQQSIRRQKEETMEADKKETTSNSNSDKCTVSNESGNPEKTGIMKSNESESRNLNIDKIEHDGKDSEVKSSRKRKLSSEEQTAIESKVRKKSDGSELTSCLSKTKKDGEKNEKKVEFAPVTTMFEIELYDQKLRKKKSKKEKPRLRVISKKEWLELKQEYISEQKSHMQALKESLRELRQQENVSTNHNVHGQHHVDLEDVFGTKRMKPSEEVKMAHVQELKFVPNVIVQWKCTHDIHRSKITTMFKEISGDSIAYIDAPEEAKSGYIRFKNESSAEEFAKASRNSTSFSARVLPIANQEDYWKKANQDRMNKLSRKKKEKGTEKIARKVFERNDATFQQKPSRIVFEDEASSSDRQLKNEENKGVSNPL